MNESNDKGVNKNVINWYPGHMAKAKREMAEAIKLIDVVIEIMDARIPISSRNPDINEIVGDRPRILVLNKSDLADEKMNQKWIQKYKEQGQTAILADCTTGKGIKEVIKQTYELKKDKIEKQAAKGRIGMTVKAMVLGIPNVGKSSFINKVGGKNSAMVGNKPGVTRKNQWYRLNDKVELMDTPGVLWPKLDNQEYARHLAYIGTIKDEVIDVEELALALLQELVIHYKTNVYQRYKIAEDFEFENPLELMEEIARKRGCILRGNELDYTKVANIILDEFRSVKLGRITLEE